MASLATVRSTVQTEIAAALGAGTQVYDKLSAKPVLPCVAIVPDVADFVVAMGRGTDTWEFNVFVLVPSGDPEVGQDRLDPYVTGAGSLSVRQAVFNARATFQAAGFDAHISAMTDYGGTHDSVGVDHVGATLRLIVHTPGTS